MPSSESHQDPSDSQHRGAGVVVDLETEASAVLSEAKAAPNGRATRTLTKEGHLRMVLLALQSGAVLAEHSAAGPLGIDVIRGEAVVEAEGASYELSGKRTLILDARVVHAVTAKSDCVIRLVIAMPG